jgi:hypothetical protein
MYVLRSSSSNVPSRDAAAGGTNPVLIARFQQEP